jgi:hypothetical protein
LLVIKLARGRIERDDDLLARFVARGLDGLHDHLQRLFIRFQIRRETALVADRGVVILFLQHAF